MCEKNLDSSDLHSLGYKVICSSDYYDDDSEGWVMSQVQKYILLPFFLFVSLFPSSRHPSKNINYRRHENRNRYRGTQFLWKGCEGLRSEVSDNRVWKLKRYKNEIQNKLRVVCSCFRKLLTLCTLCDCLGSDYELRYLRWMSESKTQVSKLHMLLSISWS